MKLKSKKFSFKQTKLGKYNKKITKCPTFEGNWKGGKFEDLNKKNKKKFYQTRLRSNFFGDITHYLSLVSLDILKENWTFVCIK